MKRSAQWLFHHTGGLRMIRWLNRRGLRILMYHRFPQPQKLEMQCRHLRDHYQALSMTEASECLKSNKPLPPNSLVVTVDDGHRDFFHTAFPIFSAHGIPTTVYLVTDFLDGRMWLWPDQVRYCFQHTKVKQVRLDFGNGTVQQFDLRSAEQRTAAAHETCSALRLVSNDDRLAVMEHLPAWLQVSIPAQPPRDCEPLGWDDVRSLSHKGVEFGAHTRTHPVLARVQSAAVLAAEISGSKQRIEEVLELPVRHFCYPNGSLRDVSAAAIAAVHEAGYDTAVTTVPGLNAPGDDPFRLRRIAVDPNLDQYYFERCVAAFRLT